MEDLFDTDPDLEEKSLSELESWHGLMKQNADDFTESSRARGGVGLTQDDEDARKFRDKQADASMEIQDRLLDIHESRSVEAQTADESKRAERADSAVEWATSPNQYDWPGIDLPDE